MKKLFSIALISIAPLIATGQSYLSPQQKAVLDFYYAQAESNSIDGAWIIDGTITTNKLSTNILEILDAAITNLNWTPANSNFADIVDNAIVIYSNTNEADKVKYNIFTESNKFTDVELDGSITSIDEIQFDITFTNGSAEGKMQWNSEDGTLEVGLPGGNVNLQIGQEQLVRVRNTTGSTITNGKAVAIIGASGNRPLIALADADAGYPTNIISGLATEDIGHNNNGYMTTEGMVRDFANSYTVGDRVYLSTTPGELTDVEPVYPVDAHEVGIVVVSGANGIVHVHFGEHKHWIDLNEEYKPLYNCLPKKGNRPILDWTVTGGIVTGIVDVVEADNELTIVFDETDYSFATPVYLQLDNGATNVQQFQYIYCTTNGITNSTTFPTGEYAMLFDLSLLDAAKTASEGVFTLRRWTDNASGPGATDDRSVIQRANERIRSMPATWISGGTLDAVVTTVGGGEDDVYITSAAGTSYQFNPQSFGAITATNGTVDYDVYNDPDLTIAHITNLNSISKDSSGNAVLASGNSFFNVAVMRHFPSGTTNLVDSSLILKLSSDDYTDEDRALADADGLLDFTVPSRMAGETLVLGFVTLNRSAAGGGTWTATVTSQLGREVGTAGGGSSSLPAANTFIDSAFRVQDDSDPSKEISFEVDQLTTATTREYTWPDKDGTVAMTDDIVSGGYPTNATGFFAHRNGSSQSLTNGVYTQINWTHETWDIGSGMDLSTDGYTPPVNGKYILIYKVDLESNSAGASFLPRMRKGSEIIYLARADHDSSADFMAFTASIIVDATTNDTYYCDAYVSVNAGNVPGGTNRLYFTGQLLSTP